MPLWSSPRGGSLWGALPPVLPLVSLGGLPWPALLGGSLWWASPGVCCALGGLWWAGLPRLSLGRLPLASSWAGLPPDPPLISSHLPCPPPWGGSLWGALPLMSLGGALPREPDLLDPASVSSQASCAEDCAEDYAEDVEYARNADHKERWVRKPATREQVQQE